MKIRGPNLFPCGAFKSQLPVSSTVGRLGRYVFYGLRLFVCLLSVARCFSGLLVCTRFV
ncbi:unnamed protein product, partial [Brassica oleracea]